VRITDVRLSRLKNSRNRVRAVVSLFIDDRLVIHDILVVEGTRGPFVSFPARKTPDGDYRPTIQFLNSELHQEVQRLILQAYHDECARPESGNTS
jgi:stage V sporulation protein G